MTSGSFGHAGLNGAGGSAEAEDPFHEILPAGELPTGEMMGGEPDPARAKPKKAPNAFRTISEVADELHIPQHVLRFWETKFPQVKPLKRGGGRRYYRPDDIALLRRISDLLYIQGYTIKGVQRLLREGGGKLSDNIPPPNADEKADPEAERDSSLDNRGPELPMPELPRTPIHAPPPVFAETTRQRPEVEVEQLRSVLLATLRELEALRALLP
jgi:DNA-binding transcriptional MerR regulator